MSAKAYNDLSQDTSITDTAMDELKNLLLKPEKTQIQKIQRRLDNPMVRANEVSRFLPDAITLSLLHNNKISRVLAPVIDAVIKASVKNNPKVMADAIFPALGPGIRKAITASIMGMIQSLNQILNHSFSIQGLKWRFEAFKTGREFGEIVLLNTLIYKVEQIFLIHRQTGIVLNHVVAQDTLIQDPDLVSGMLTAIQDFVSDSFQSSPDDDLETLRIGSNRSVWIEKGEHACIAAVIQGTPPMALRAHYRKLIDEIHIMARDTLENFDGDPFPFSIFKDQLNEGLQYQKKNQEKKSSVFIWCIFITIFVLSFLWGFDYFQDQKAWTAYIDRLKTQKGLIVLSTTKKNGQYQIFGLKDPLEKDPENLILSGEKNRITVKGNWKSFYSLDPEFILQRANLILNPPSTIELKILNNTLHVAGKASRDWLIFLQKTAPAITGIHMVDVKDVQSIEARNLATALKTLVELKIYFKTNSSQLLAGQEDTLNTIFKTLDRIHQLKKTLKDPVQIVILGHTDSSGTEKLNQRLSRDRAKNILDFLISKGIDPAFLNISGVGTKSPLKEENSIEDRQYNRAISFKISSISKKGQKT